jgi:hypothetical protein
MKFSRNNIVTFLLLIVIASLYRIMPGRPMGFAPQIAMALFAGSMVKNHKYAFAFPLLSMFLSDLLYEMLFINRLTQIQGFYSGQLTNYLMICSISFIGFYINRKNISNILTGSIVAPTLYFLASNFMVWIGGGGYHRPKTFSGLLMCMADGIPFYQTSILATLFFGAVLFGGYHLIQKSWNTSLAK